MTREEKIKEIERLKISAMNLKKEVDYYNALQLALKLVLNGSYGAFATQYFVLFNNHVAGTITAHGRDLTKRMHMVNEHYWYNIWHNDTELHNMVNVRNVSKISKDEPVSIYADTDSLFVSFKPVIDHSEWFNLYLNDDYVKSIDYDCIILSGNDIKSDNSYIRIVKNESDLRNILSDGFEKLIIDGSFVKQRWLGAILDEVGLDRIIWNWSSEQDYIQGLDKFRYDGYFKKCLEEYANEYGVDNKSDFELERISESMINIAKKKYICHITHEDGIDYSRLSYIYPKGVELVRSSTPLFAREKIIEIINYLFSNPDTFNIKELLKLVKSLRKEFELANIDDICMQSSVSNYDTKVIEDKVLPLSFVNGTHFAVKAGAHYNYLLNKNKVYQQKYEFIKSGNKVKYFYTKDSSIGPIFAYIRGSFPMEFAPEVDYDKQFAKSILSPINSIIEPLGLPTITERLRVVNDIFGGL